MPLPKFLRHKNSVFIRVLVFLVLAVLSVMAYRAYGWAGIALGLGALVMWVLMHMSRILVVLRRTAQRPVGTVASAVMLHSRLERGMALLQVLALTQAMGQRVDSTDPEVEAYLWTDTSDASVRCSFANGKLVDWQLQRP